MTDANKTNLGPDIPFAVVLTELADGRECWSIIHVPCGMPTGNDPGWWTYTLAVSDVKLWWGNLSSEQQAAFRGTDIQAMRDRECETALDELVELSDFRLVGDEA
jgi:hypothetical protein